MLNVLLVHTSGDEKIVTVTALTFSECVKAVRDQEPDRRWQIFESWEIAQ